jgi:hypothetical protein
MQALSQLSYSPKLNVAGHCTERPRMGPRGVLGPAGETRHPALLRASRGEGGGGLYP